MQERRGLPWWGVFFAIVGGLVGAVSLLAGIWLFFEYTLYSLAESFASELAEVMPLNKGYIKSITLIIFIIIIPLASITFSISANKRKYGTITGLLLMAGFYAVLGFAHTGFKVNPLSGAPVQCYSILNGEVTYHDLVAGLERQFDPKTGRPCIPVTPAIAEKLTLYERAIVPERIPDGVEPDMFERTLGTPLVWYYRAEDGIIELFDNEGFHPDTSQPLSPITADVARIWRAQRELRLKLARDAEESKAEQDRLEAIESQRQEDLRKASGNDCDRLAGNAFDQNRNPQFPGVPYQLLAVNADAAAQACRVASIESPAIVRYKYQLARALQTRASQEARDILHSLVQYNYPAAFDNLGWMLVRENQARGAIELFRHGSDLGNPEAMVSLAGFLSEGRWVAKNDREAMTLLSTAAKLGHPSAIEAMRKYDEQKKIGQVGGAIIGLIIGEIIKKK